MAKNDNTKTICYDLKAVVLDTNSKGELVFINDDIGEVKLDSILSEFLGREIDFKIGGATKITPELFENESGEE